MAFADDVVTFSFDSVSILDQGKGMDLVGVECKCVLHIVSFEIPAGDGGMPEVFIQSVFNLV